LKRAVLVLSSTYPRWSQDTVPAFVHELCSRLTDEFSVHVVTPHSEGAQRYEEMDGVKIHRFVYAPPALERLVYPGGMLTNVRLHPWTVLLLPFFFLSLLWVTLRVARRQDVVLLHAHWLIPQGLAVLLLRPLLRRQSLLVTSHGADVYGLRGDLFGYLKKKVWAVADAVTVVSKAMVKEVTGMIDPARLSVAPMGVDLQQRFVCSEPIEGRSDVIFVGRLVEKKGVDVLLRGVAELAPEFSGLRLRIIGDGPYREDLLRLTDKLGIASQVDFIGAVPNDQIPGWLNRHAVAVVPSVVAAGGDQEGLGLVSVEAMGCGCAVLASDLPAIHDVVEQGRTGLFFEPGNPRALADGLRRLLANEELRCELAAAGGLSVREKFDWSSVAAKYRDIYQRLL